MLAASEYCLQSIYRLTVLSQLRSWGNIFILSHDEHHFGLSGGDKIIWSDLHIKMLIVNQFFIIHLNTLNCGLHNVLNSCFKKNI